MERVFLRTFGVLGVILFAPLFLLTFADPHVIEKSGKSFIEWKLQSEANMQIDAVQLPEPTKLEVLLGAKARELRAKTEKSLEKVKQQLKADAPAILAEQIAKLQNLDCECRKKWQQSIRVSMEAKLASLEAAKSKLVEFSHVKYMEIIHKLTLDVRIFLGVNAAVFIFLLIASFMQPRAVKQLFLPGGLMLASTAVCSYFYLFEQNWFYTIIYSDYTGFAYVGYWGLVFAILCDIVFNRARVTTEVLNACLTAIGQAGNLAPC
ncbi:hypothetical protein ACJJIF_06060 [Microbulbifer sp. SSSA002]|uniref:hypothetical protein n=1 Tax=Microbulbifer sp. SSSA002 TaxID=3243376 RepID=UPI0040392966